MEDRGSTEIITPLVVKGVKHVDLTTGCVPSRVLCTTQRASTCSLLLVDTEDRISRLGIFTHELEVYCYFGVPKVGVGPKEAITCQHIRQWCTHGEGVAIVHA